MGFWYSSKRKKKQTFLPIEISLTPISFSKQEEIEEKEPNELDEKIWDIEEDWEEHLYNKKKGHQIVRSSQKNKKEKINPDRYVNGPRYFKRLSRENFAKSFHNPREYTPITNNSISNQNNDHDLALAIQLSEKEFKAQNETSLTFQQVLDLQNRELTPEDYELLLLLDEGVKKKTVPKNIVDSFPTTIVEESIENSCTICLNEYGIGEKLKTLPCGHQFHADCIAQWLLSSSTNCPIDNLPLEST